MNIQILWSGVAGSAGTCILTFKETASEMLLSNNKEQTADLYNNINQCKQTQNQENILYSSFYMKF